MRDRIIKIMQEKGIMSMAELERKSGIPSGTMRNIGQGHMPSMEKVRKIANFLDVSVDWLVNGYVKEEEPVIKEPVKPVKVSSSSAREFMGMVASLNDQNMEALTDYLRYLLSRQERD